jgi:hypothetical protein
MRRVGQTRRRDANEKPIVQALRQTGIIVQPISAPGLADLVCFDPLSGRFRLIEVKAAKGTLTPAQVEMHCSMPIDICRTPEEAMQLFRGSR